MFRQSNPANKSLKVPAQLVPVLSVVLLAGSIFFYRERMLFIDGPHVLFRIINDKKLFISDYRYGAFITQLFPLAGAKLHLPLRWLMLLYSASFCFFYLITSLLLVHLFRNYKLAILFGLYLTLFASATFYWPNNEVHQGVAWLFLAWGTLFFMANNKVSAFITFPIIAALFYLAIFTHPLLMIITAYLWIFHWLYKKEWPFSPVQSIVYSAVLLIIIYLKYRQGLHDGYDSSKFDTITGFNFHQLKKIFSSPELKFFVKSCFTNYWAFLILFVAGIISLARERKIALLVLTLAASGGYLLLICIAFPDATAKYRFYMESEYMPLVVLGCTPFVYCTLPGINHARVATLLALIFVSRLIYIASAAPVFTSRIVILDNILDKMKEKNLAKVIIKEPAPQPDSALVLNWGAAVESFCLSALEGHTPQRTFLFSDEAQLKSLNTNSKDTFLGCWEKRPISQLNSRYFQFDTTATYVTTDYSSLMH